MSVRIKQAAGFQLGSDYNNQAHNMTAFTVAFRVRLNVTPPDMQNFPLIDMGFGNFAFGNAYTSSNAIDVYEYTALYGTVYSTTKLLYGVPQHVVFTYDKDAPSRQAIYVNGAPTVSGSPVASAFAANQIGYMNFGTISGTVSGNVDLNLEHVLMLCGYAVDATEAAALANGADPTTFGASAPYRNYWTLEGPKGATPTVADAGFANVLSPSWAPQIFINSQTGTSLTYDDAIPYSSPVACSDHMVYTSGRYVRTVLSNVASGSPVFPTAGSLTGAATIKINGGSPQTLVNPVYSTSRNAVLWKCPAGVTIAPGDDVKLSLSTNWIGTSIGAAPGVVDAPVVNRSGVPLYGDMPPDVRVGLNFSFRSTCWDAGIGPRNLALRAQTSYDGSEMRADQTVDVNIAFPVLAPPQPALGPDFGQPNVVGLYALGYDDLDPADPTTIILETTDWEAHLADALQERTEYHNPGAPDGTGVVRVYELQVAVSNATAAAAIGAADTVVSLADMSKITNQPNAQAIRFDSEYMLITGFDTTAKTITVTRGWYGTTAAAHASGSVGTIVKTSPAYSARLNFSNASGVPKYRNLVLYGPFDWTPPDPPAPVVLDTSFEYQRHPSASMQQALAPGVGVVRQMDSTDGGAGRGLEFEHMRQDSDLWTGLRRNFFLTPKVATVQAATAASVPFVYSAYYLENAVKYPVTLAAAVTTAPASGTIETIQITEDAANPVFYGQRIELPGGETVRVVGRTGSSVDVVRGCDGTTPTTHAAGSCQARWRIAVPNDAALKANDEARMLATTTADHGLWNGIAAYPESNDLNTLARINVTLSAAVDATTTTFPVTAAAGDLQYLVPGLYIVFDSECVVVKTAYNSSTGSIGVARAAAASTPGRVPYPPSAAAAHASGTVGTGSSGGVFCVSSDGTTHGWSDTAKWALSLLSAGPNRIVAGATALPTTTPAQSWTVVGTQTFAPIVDDASACWTSGGPDSVNSYEQSARVTTLAPGADHWLNVPQWASDDAVDAIASRIRDGLPAGRHRVLVELGNEVWNFMGPRWAVPTQLGQIIGYTDQFDQLVHRSWSVFKRVQAVFAAQGRGGDVLWVLAWQLTNVDRLIQSAKRLGIDGDIGVVSTAPYYSPISEPTMNAAYDAATDAEALDVWKFDLEYDSNNVAGALRIDGKARTDYETASGRTIEFIHYEGGPDSFTPHPAADVTNGRLRNVDLHYNPNCWHACYDFAYICRRIGRSDGIAYFNYNSAEFWNSGGQYGSLWGMAQWPFQKPGRGDGSNGGVDNRLCLAAPGQPNTKPGWVNINERNESVRLQSMLDYAKAYNAANPVPGGGGGRPRQFVPRSYRARLRRWKRRS